MSIFKKIAEFYKQLFKRKRKALTPEQIEQQRTKDFFDMILPSTIKFSTDHYIVGDSYRCVWAIREYPPSTEEQAILAQLADKNGVTLRMYHRLVESIPGNEYTIKGILMDKATNSPFLSDGKEVTSEVVFTPEQANGTVNVQFVLDAALITKETDIVVFEDQTVTIRPVPVIPPPTINIPKTGDETNLSLWLSIGAVAVGAVISFLIIRFRRKDEDDDE